jgi:hypothetical protein
MGSLESKRDRLLELETERGPERLTLRVADWEVEIGGLDAELAEVLEARWGDFVGRAVSPSPTVRLRILKGDAGLSLGRDRPGEIYRLEAEREGGCMLVRSHHVAICAEPDDPGAWRAGLTITDAEPPARIVENVVRYLMARLCVAGGGFALHGAGVLRDGRAHLFAGPSRSGKTTAVGLSPGGTSLGDDFSIVIDTAEGWRTTAVPFDNLERPPESPPTGWIPVAAIWRLERSAETDVRIPAAVQATASLMASATFPWAMPDLTDAMLEHVRSFVSTSVFGILSFTKESDFWPLIESRI